ncbi:MAG: response regulator [Deltaproteobacteria bacterium]|nr:response regulator [Deltaproteobacteria bacterium]
MTGKILVIDDENSIRNVLRIHLSSAGYSVITASNGRDGLEAASAEDIDLVMCDLKLPDMSGIDIINILKVRSPDMPIIAISGFIDENLIEEVKKTSAVEYLKKPFQKQEVISLVKKVIGKNEKKR